MINYRVARWSRERREWVWISGKLSRERAQYEAQKLNDMFPNACPYGPSYAAFRFTNTSVTD